MPVVDPSTGNPPIIVDERYTVTCRSCVAKDVTGDQFGNNAKLEFGLEIEGLTNGDVWEDAEQPNDPFVFTTRINRKWNEKSTFFIWTKAFGIDADDDLPFDSDALLGRKAIATFETEEPGKWPKIVRMSRVPAQKVAKNAPTAVPPTLPGPALVNFMGEIDYTAFWKGIEDIGVTREQVAGELNGDLNNLKSMEATLIVDLFEHLKEKYGVPA